MAYNLNVPVSPWFWFVVLLFALAFCGEPDLQDALVQRVMPEPTP